MLDTSEIKDMFIADLKNGNVGDVNEWIDSLVDNEVIYTSDCYEIMSELMITDFDEYIMNLGEVKSIQGLAWFYLREHIYESVDDINDFDEIRELYERYEEIQSEIENLDEEEEEEDINDLKIEMEEVEEQLSDYGFEF